LGRNPRTMVLGAAPQRLRQNTTAAVRANSR